MLCPDGALTSPMWFVLVHKSELDHIQDTVCSWIFLQASNTANSNPGLAVDLQVSEWRSLSSLEGYTDANNQQSQWSSCA